MTHGVLDLCCFVSLLLCLSSVLCVFMAQNVGGPVPGDGAFDRRGLHEQCARAELTAHAWRETARRLQDNLAAPPAQLLLQPAQTALHLHHQTAPHPGVSPPQCKSACLVAKYKTKFGNPSVSASSRRHLAPKLCFKFTPKC